MITLIHGEDTVLSRKKLREEIEKFKDAEAITLDGIKVDITEFITVSQSSSFISSQKIIIIENLLSGGLNANKQKILAELSKNSNIYPIILCEKKEIEKNAIKKYFPQVKEILCKYPALLFRFLNILGLDNPQTTLIAFRTLLSQKEPDFIFNMILWQWRNMIIAKDKGVKAFPGKQSWQVEKYLRQVQRYTMLELVSLYRQLLLIDYKIKNGLTPLSIKQHLDFFILNL